MWAIVLSNGWLCGWHLYFNKRMSVFQLIPRDIQHHFRRTEWMLNPWWWWLWLVLSRIICRNFCVSRGKLYKPSSSIKY
ncbi:hypothetical protein PILCRDRAFT_596784 [Piloderma croceum F 1598]|uniref:Uncharacterized protein n=1 Tax=Piloderma croceum (strain F 1598) TaxID=765440 RepID=A0A0C3FEI1_PILCF|nr:hypothetical protein PILCRDRAFT_596784 [Piloderma croceum F 1598]